MNDQNNIESCPVCLMEVESSECCNLECNHPLHVGCAEGLRQLKCPICRKELKGYNLDKNIINKIQDNASKDKKEEESATLRRTEELIRNLLRDENEYNSGYNSELLSYALFRILRHPDLRFFLTILGDLNFEPTVCVPIIKKIVGNVIDNM